MYVYIIFYKSKLVILEGGGGATKPNPPKNTKPRKKRKILKKTRTCLYQCRAKIPGGRFRISDFTKNHILIQNLSVQSSSH